MFAANEAPQITAAVLARLYRHAHAGSYETLRDFTRYGFEHGTGRSGMSDTGGTTGTTGTGRTSFGNTPLGG